MLEIFEVLLIINSLKYRHKSRTMAKSFTIMSGKVLSRMNFS
jgi:hypothetical protein